MTFQFRKLLTASLLALTAVSTLALSQDTGWYAGLGFGQSKAKNVDCSGTTSCDDKDTAFNIFGGYRFNKNFGAELGYWDLGKYTASGTGFTDEIKAKGFELSAVGTLPINEKFSIYAKVGAFRWDLDVNVSATGLGSASESESGTDLTYAIGFKYHFTKNIAAGLAWQRFNDLGKESTTGKSDVDVIGGHLIYSF